MIRRWSTATCALCLLLTGTALPTVDGAELTSRPHVSAPLLAPTQPETFVFETPRQKTRSPKTTTPMRLLYPPQLISENSESGFGNFLHVQNAAAPIAKLKNSRNEVEPTPCAEDALYSQRCATFDPNDSIGYSPSDLDTGYVSYEGFWGVRGVITGVSWYGFFGVWSYYGCTPEPATFEIRVFEDDAGTPGAEVAFYTIEAYGEPTQMDLGEFMYATKFTADFAAPIELENGWISIAAIADSNSDCIFYWLSSPEGDGYVCNDYNGERNCNQDLPDRFDLNLCILGEFYPGACCYDLTGDCQSNVEYVDCPPTARFTPGVTCENMDPPCGDITGACCDGADCQMITPGDCAAIGGVYRGNYVPCDPNPCVGACCLGDMQCDVLMESECLALGGDYIGDGTDCDPIPCPPLNDDCTGATAITEGQWPFNSTYATTDGPEHCNIAQNVWFCYTASTTGTVTVYIGQYSGGYWISTGAVYNGCTCDPFPEPMVCGDGNYTFTFDAQAGEQYLLEIGSAYGEADGGEGYIEVSIDAWLYGACCIDAPPYCIETYEPYCTGTFLGDGVACDPTDCNENDIPDACEIIQGMAEDCNGNGVPDECDLADGVSADYDMNGVPDECDPDCNENGVPDICDTNCDTGDCINHPLGCGGSDDCQYDGVPDECQLGGAVGDENIIYDNGGPAYEDPYYNVLFSQIGGYQDGAFVVDDVYLPEGGTINTFHAYFEDSLDYEWTGRIRLEIYAHSDEFGPDQSSGPYFEMWIPDDGGVAERTVLGERPAGVACTYDLTGLDIELPAGVWWFGIATVGGMNGNSAWSTSQSDTNLIGSECFIRWPGVGVPDFIPGVAFYGMTWDVSFTLGSTISGGDCNDNGIPDECDILYCDGSPWCLDCNENGVPDGCEPDCDGNEIADECDIRDCDGSPWCLDCNANGIPDGCEPDCNGNGVPDDCDLRDCDGSPWCSDCNQNGAIDECDIADGLSDDYDLNGVPDECDPDCNENGVPDSCDLDCTLGDCASHPLGCNNSPDCQPEGIPDECQLFGEFEYLTDNGVSDTSVGLTDGGYLGWMTNFRVEEGYETIDAINLSWGIVPERKPATVYIWSDFNGDGNPFDAKVLASVNTMVTDPQQDIFVRIDMPDTYIGPVGTSFFVGVIMHTHAGDRPAPINAVDSQYRSWLVRDLENPIDPNYMGTAGSEPEPIDIHLSGNWLLRAVGAFNDDCNENGVPDACDIAEGYSADCDANGVPDECEWADCNENGVLDACDILDCPAGELWCVDCDENGVPDECDIADGAADCQPNGVLDACEEDCDGNGVPDECDMRDCTGEPWCDDCNADGVIDGCQVSEPGGAVYIYDDGTAENLLGGDEDSDFVWIQRYDAIFGSETIVAISTCFGLPEHPGYSGVFPGQPFRVFIWDDADNDGDPSDAVLLGEVTAYAEDGSIDSDVFQVVPIDPVVVDGSFFIGAATVTSMWPAPVDEDTELRHDSWIASAPASHGGFDPENFTAANTDDLGFPTNFLLRAHSEFGPGVNDCNGNGLMDECELCGDLDMDDDVDYDDYVLFVEAFGGVTDGDPMHDWCCDYDGTGAVGIMDFATWLDCYRDFIGDPYAQPPVDDRRPLRKVRGAAGQAAKSAFKSRSKP